MQTDKRTYWIAGIDEAGRGPLAGPVVAAAVILPDDIHIPGLTDSKKLTEKQREALFVHIQEAAVGWAIGRAEVEEIDRVNILQATFLAMHRAFAALPFKPHQLLIDGNQSPKIDCQTKMIIQGDLTEPCISAASILAKVTRDREMIEWDKQYSQYGFASHKGYGTKTHIEALRKHGPCPIHRKTFAPVSQLYVIPA